MSRSVGGDTVMADRIPDGIQARIRELVIENFRGIERLSLSFLGPAGAATSVAILAGRRVRRSPETEENRVWLLKQYLVNARLLELMATSRGGGPVSGDGASPGYQWVIDRLNETWATFYPGTEEGFAVEPILPEDPE